MDCRECRNLLTEYFDLRPGPPRDEVIEHLEACAQCSRIFDQWKRTVDRLTPERRIVPTKELKERIMKESHDFDFSVIHGTKPGISRRNWFKPLAAIAAIVMVVAVASLLGPDSIFNKRLDPDNPQQLLSLVTKAMADQQEIINSPGIVHMVVEEILPDLDDAGMAAARWFMQPTFRPDGKLQYNRIMMRAKPHQPYKVRKDIWFDNDHHRFASVISFKGQTLFAHSYDGSKLYTFPDGEKPEAVSVPVAPEFELPENVPKKLGAVPSDDNDSSLTAKNERITIVGEDTLDNGERVRVMETSGIPTPSGRITSKFIRRIRISDNSLAETEFIMHGKTSKYTRYTPPEKVRVPDSRWSLKDLDPVPDSVRDIYGLSVELDVLRSDISQEEMLELTDRPLCDLASLPSWTTRKSITMMCRFVTMDLDFMIVFVASPGGRHVVIQDANYFARIADLSAPPEPFYVTPSGFRLFSMVNQEKWSANIAISASSGVHHDKPAEDRTAYFVQAPDSSWCQLAINGTLSDEQLHSLADMLVLVGEKK